MQCLVLFHLSVLNILFPSSYHTLSVLIVVVPDDMYIMCVVYRAPPAASVPATAAGHVPRVHVAVHEGHGHRQVRTRLKLYHS